MIMIMMAFWIMVTNPSLCSILIRRKRTSFPTTPPITDPMPKVSAIFFSNVGSDLTWLPVDTIAMVKTVMLDRMLMEATSKSPRKSITGLMMTPPPMPVMAPRVVASNDIAEYIIDWMSIVPYF